MLGNFAEPVRCRPAAAAATVGLAPFPAAAPPPTPSRPGRAPSRPAPAGPPRVQATTSGGGVRPAPGVGHRHQRTGEARSGREAEVLEQRERGRRRALLPVARPGPGPVRRAGRRRGRCRSRPRRRPPAPTARGTPGRARVSSAPMPAASRSSPARTRRTSPVRPPKRSASHAPAVHTSVVRLTASEANTTERPRSEVMASGQERVDCPEGAGQQAPDGSTAVGDARPEPGGRGRHGGPRRGATAGVEAAAGDGGTRRRGGRAAPHGDRHQRQEAQEHPAPAGVLRHQPGQAGPEDAGEHPGGRDDGEHPQPGRLRDRPARWRCRRWA